MSEAPASETSALADPGPASDGAIALARELGLSLTVADCLFRRGFKSDEDTRRYLDPRLAHLTPPDGMVGRPETARRLGDAIRNGERIVVFGDYDCDGITSAAIMTGVLRELGGDAVPLLATRTEGAYGLSEPALRRILAAQPSVLVTCDCGSSDHPRVQSANEAGIDVIVIDHHLVPEKPLPALAFLNPHRPECNFPYKGLASCGLALSVAAALRKELGQALDVRPYLDLVAIGTIADVAPLTADNRVLVRAGLNVLARATRPGLRAMAEVAGFDLRRGMSAEDVAFRIAPRLNAPGRLGTPDAALQLLLAPDMSSAHELAASVEQLTLQRREVQADIVAAADADIEAHGYAEADGIVLARQGWHPGVVGIVAGRVADRTQRPTIVFGLEGHRGRGSVRGPAGFPLYDALCRCSDHLVGFGGHQAAAGCEVEADRVDQLRAAWVDACRALDAKGHAGGNAAADVRLDARDDPQVVLRDLERVEPTGEKNPPIRLLLKDVQVSSARDIKGHLKLELRLGRLSLMAIGFGKGHLCPTLASGNRTVDIVGRLRRDHYRGGDAVELHIDEVGA